MWKPEDGPPVQQDAADADGIIRPGFEARRERERLERLERRKGRPVPTTDPMDVALERVRTRYIDGEIEADEFEYGVGKLLEMDEVLRDDANRVVVPVDASDFTELADPEFSAVVDLIHARRP